MEFHSKIRTNVKECAKRKDHNWLLCQLCVDYGHCQTYRQHIKTKGATNEKRSRIGGKEKAISDLHKEA